MRASRPPPARVARIGWVLVGVVVLTQFGLIASGVLGAGAGRREDAAAG